MEPKISSLAFLLHTSIIFMCIMLSAIVVAKTLHFATPQRNSTLVRKLKRWNINSSKRKERVKKHIFDSFLLDYSVEGRKGERQNVFKNMLRNFSTRTFMYEQISRDYARHKFPCFNFDEECRKISIFSSCLFSFSGVYRNVFCDSEARMLL